MLGKRKTLSKFQDLTLSDLVNDIKNISMSDASQISQKLLNYQSNISNYLQNNPKDANDHQLITEILACTEKLNDIDANQIIENFTNELQIGSRNPLWIASCALTYERVQNYIMVFYIYQNAFDQHIDPPFLKDQYNKFITRMNKRLTSVVKLDLGILNRIQYSWRAGKLVTTKDGRHVEPEIDVLGIIGISDHNKTIENSFSMIRTEKPAYDANLLLSTDGTTRSFIEARLANIGIDFVRQRKEKEMKAQPRVPLRQISPRGEPKQNESIIKLPSRTKGNKSTSVSSGESAITERKPLSIIKSSFIAHEISPDDDNERHTERLNNEQFLQSLRQKTPRIFPTDDDDDDEPKPEKRRPLAPISSSTSSSASSSTTKGILKRGDSKATNMSPSRVKIQGSPVKAVKNNFTRGEKINADGLMLEVKDKLGTKSYLCEAEDCRKFFVKISQVNKILRELEHKELFSIPEPRYETYFLVPYLQIPLKRVIDVISKKTVVDQSVALFFLLHLTRILFALESANSHHGDLSTDSFMYRLPNSELRAFDDREGWEECGLCLTKCDGISHGRDLDERKKALEIFLKISKIDPSKMEMPKRWNKEIWTMAVSALSNKPGAPSLKSIEAKVLTFLIEKGDSVKSQIARINIELLQ